VLTLLRQARFLGLLGLGALLAVGCAFAGVWQVHRYEDKHVTNAELRHNAAQPAVPVAELLDVGKRAAAHDQFRKVTARGRYDESGQVFVRQRQVDNQAGFLVLTPLRTDAGPTLWVVRGWTRVEGSATQTPDVPPPPAGEVTLTGRVYPSEHGGVERGLPQGQVERIDVPALARGTGLPAYGGYVELVSQRPEQRGVLAMPAPDLSNPAGGAFEGQHLAYIVQWFVFAALALVAPPLLGWLDLRRSGEGDDSPDAGQPTAPDQPGPEREQVDAPAGPVTDRQ
jgi:cytochrome oxidase assembly protein ShyY1